jgi:hypothetical protein
MMFVCWRTGGFGSYDVTWRDDDMAPGDETGAAMTAYIVWRRGATCYYMRCIRRFPYRPRLLFRRAWPFLASSSGYLNMDVG